MSFFLRNIFKSFCWISYFNFTFQGPEVKEADKETDEDIDVVTVENINVETVENNDVENVNIDDRVENDDTEKEEETKAKVDIKSLKEIHAI